MSGGFYFGAIIDGINRAAARVGGRTVVLQTIDPDRYEEPDTTLRSGPFALPVAWSHLDGMVVISGAVRLPYLQRLRAAGVPIVQVSHEFPDFAAPIVKPDNMGGIALAVTHLIEHGHRSIAFAGNLAQDDIRERYEGYQSALRSHGIEPDEKLFFPTTDNMIRGGRDAGQALLTSASPATAIVAATDTNALGILEALREAGRSVPDDLAVTGFDNVEEAAVNTPALTTVSVPFGRLGELATSLVLEYRNGAPVADLVYTGPASLMIRQSCGCGRASARTTPASAAGELAEGLRVLLLPDQTPPAETSRRFEAALTGVMGFFSQAAGPATPDHASTAAVAARLHAFANRCETRRQVVELLHRYVTTAAGADPAVRTRMDAALLRLTLELADAESHAQSRLQVETERRMAAVYDIGMVLLRSDEEDPSTMVWLGRTGAPAGCLGLWADGGLSPGDALRIVGVHGSPLDRLRDTRVPVNRFPPEPLLAQADAGAGQIVYAVPVAVAGSHWGMLAA
ncbi:MAG: substrate-binding domain-containing protein, partial [Micromonosporaceae bacterium]|nr:substrate-binding domain-containing protein [Micromonosporaceae bacterium]